MGGVDVSLPETHLNVYDKNHGRKLGKGGVQCLQGDISRVIPYLQWDHRAEKSSETLSRGAWTTCRSTDALEEVPSRLCGSLEVQGFSGG